MKKEQLLLRKSVLEKMLKNSKHFENNLCDYNLILRGRFIITDDEYYCIRKLLGELKYKNYATTYVWIPKDWEVRAKWLLEELKKVNKKLRRKEKISNFFGAIKGLFALNRMFKKWNFNTW